MTERTGPGTSKNSVVDEAETDPGLPVPSPRPAVGRVAHYVSYGSAGGEYGRECRAATVTEVHDARCVGLAVLNPTGMFFHRTLFYDPGTEPSDDGQSRQATNLCGGLHRQGGTWHWPERVS